MTHNRIHWQEVGRVRENPGEVHVAETKVAKGLRQCPRVIESTNATETLSKVMTGDWDIISEFWAGVKTRLLGPRRKQTREKHKEGINFLLV